MNQLEATLQFLQSSIPEVEQLILNMDNFKISPELVVKFNKNSNIPDLVLEYYAFDKNHFMLELKVKVLEYLKTSPEIVPEYHKMTVMEIIKSDIKKICNCFKPKKIVKRSNCEENTTVEFRSKSRIN